MSGSALLDELRRLWAEVLELPPRQVRPDCHFLQLGGDSLHWTRMTRRVQELWGLELPAHPEPATATLGKLAAYCNERLVQSRLTRVSSVSPTGEYARFPPTGMQQGLWFAEQLAGNGKLYQSAVLLHFSGPVDVDRLGRAFRQLQQEVPILRSTFSMDERTRRLWASCRSSDVMVSEACRTIEPDALRTALYDDMQIPMALERGPLCRSQLFRTGAERYHLLLIAHHLICDGWSGDLLLRRLAHAYATNGKCSGSQPVDSAFAAFAWRAWRHQQVLDPQALDWWRSQLTQLDTSQLWLWQGQPHFSWPHAVVRYRMPVPEDLRVRCEATALAAGVSSFVLYQAACKLALWRMSGEQRQILAIPCAVRSPAEEQAIGCFVDMHLSVSNLDLRSSTTALLQSEAARFRQARAAALSLPTLCAELKPRRLPDGNPWSSVLFAFQNFPRFASHWQGLDCRVERLLPTHSQFALTLELLREEGSWHFSMEYARSLFDVARLSALKSALLESLEQLAD